jgi:hypothetical protein
MRRVSLSEHSQTPEQHYDQQRLHVAPSPSLRLQGEISMPGLQTPMQAAAGYYPDGTPMNSFSRMNEFQQSTPLPASRHLEDASLLLGLNGQTNGGASMMPFETMSGAPQQMGTIPYNAMPGEVANEMNYNGLVFPGFFEQIMMPDMDLPQQAVLPPDVSNFTADLTFDDTDFDFSFLASGLTRPSTAQGMRPQDTVSNAPTDQTNHSSDAHLRSEAFKRNPWSWSNWIPERNSHTFSGQETLDVRQARVSADDALTTPDSVRPVHCDLHHSDRDRMIRLVTQIASTKLSIPSFPSLELLEDVIEIFLLQESSAIDSYYHSSSFSSKDVCTELLISMVASGARHIALPQVWKMGLTFQEVVRLAIAELLESDNTQTRQLQPIQAFILALDIGVWSGFRRKTEIAISFLQPPVTMLSWANAFRKFGYVDFVPTAEDSEPVLTEKWHGWIERESRKRLILHTFLHDSQVALVNMKNHLISPCQLQMPLPSCRELWLAPNAHAWRHTYLRRQPPLQADTPTMLEFFGNNTMLTHYHSNFDTPLCLLTSCHGLGQEVWQFRTHARLLANWSNLGRRDRWLDNQRKQRDLYEDLSTLQAYCDLQTNSSPEIILTLELFMMSLHVDMEIIQTFSGKLGEEEARKVYPQVLTWSQSGESRCAVWHAGQVFRVARTFEKTKLRDFYAVALYLSALTLWVYGMITHNVARKSGADTPRVQTPHNTASASLPASTASQRTFIDNNDDKAARSFKLLAQGTAGIQDLQSAFVPLSNSKGLMSTAQAILKSNFPQSRNGLPPLVENLAKLMNELGNLSGRE